ASCRTIPNTAPPHPPIAYRGPPHRSPLPRGAISDIMSAMRFHTLLGLVLAVPMLAAPVRIYVTNSDDNKITIIDPATDRVTGDMPAAPNPHGIVPSPDGARFYVSSESKDVLDVVDRKTSTVIRKVPLGTRPNNVAITPDGKRVYICIRGESWVDIVDTASLER